MFERGDYHVFHEPFGASYYFSNERRSQRASDIEPKPEYAFGEKLKKVLETSRNQSVFIKEQAYQAEVFIEDATLAKFTNTFLLRHPKEVIPSLFDKMQDFTEDELGYKALYGMFIRCREISGQPPVVIDSDDLVNYPDQTVKAYCRTVGIPFIEDSLTWESGILPQFIWWEGGSWLKDVGSSKEFKTTQKSYVDIADNIFLQDAYSRSLPYYEAMIAHKL
ncbi:MAG: sulfotransferase family protein [Candidatus Electrothrix sp. LOE2]|nr:sulfotransferase family protein [Candidatus Electrothrix sp. LOE2]